MKIVLIITIFCLFFSNNINAQNQYCKVKTPTANGKYEGKCKDGFANGKGTYHYNDSMYYEGNFQDGVREGKGEMHIITALGKDSIVKGFWSADEFRGSKYKTYNFMSSISFDMVEVMPSAKSGNTVTIEISITTGNMTSSPVNSFGMITVQNLQSLNGRQIRKQSSFANPYKSSVTYYIDEFPIRLLGNWSNGETFELELYKAANWTTRLYMNK